MPGSETKKARDRERMKRIRAAGKWQTIEIAPRDSLLLLSCVGWQPSKFKGEPWPVKVGGWWGDEWHVFGASWKPTHWMPLPPPPKPST